MALGTWWRGDSLPNLPALPLFSVRPSTDTTLIAKLNDLSLQEIDARFQNGNSAYLAFIDETPVAYGWVATKSGGVEEIGLAFTLAPGNRYLWDFQTLPEWRGRGIYACFLQAIIRQEMQLAERFWLLYKPGSVAAERSIRNAGFHILGELVLTDDHVSGFELFEQSDRAIIGAALLQLPVVVEDENR
jgi:GNAT superfamily N-acetyltransferase